MHRLAETLGAIEGQPYKAYRRLAGEYRFAVFVLRVDHIQSDPFATPSRLAVQVAPGEARLPESAWRSPLRRAACEDFLGRRLRAAIGRRVRGRRGTGHSGEIRLAGGAQQVLQRTAVQVRNGAVEARLGVGLPAEGRRVLADQAQAMLLEELPALVQESLLLGPASTAALEAHLASVEDQAVLRQSLHAAGLAAFVGEGAVLPRRSGVDDHPLESDVRPFAAPAGLRREIDLPHAGRIAGMGIPRGVTLIVGGGFHGKSTLLRALADGIYNHAPGDGRERVVADPTAVKVRAEDGRAVNCVDIRPFIGRLPFARDTRAFTTANASGSTSQAANIVEALAAGTRLLLLDEDTSATNFMIRDARMQALVPPAQEPIIPFLHRVRELYERCGVSSVIVTGGSGDYFEVADTVIMMDAYRARERTAQAHALAGAEVRAAIRSGARWPAAQGGPRRPRAAVVDASRGHRRVRIDVPDTRLLRYGEHRVDLSGVEQLVDRDQLHAAGWMLHRYAVHYAALPLIEGLRRVFQDVQQEGLDCLTPWPLGDLALPRLHEVAAAANRIREGDWC